MEARKFDPHYTIRDWENWEGKWELIDGIPISMSPTPSPVHQKVVSNLHTLFSVAVNSACEKCAVYPPLDWIVDEENVFEPDMLLVCEEEGTWEDDRLKKPPILVVEVLSPSTRKKDLTVKRTAYAESGIRYYLTVDPDNTEILILKNTGNEFEEIYQGKGESTEFDLGPCKIKVDLADTWFRIPKTR